MDTQSTTLAPPDTVALSRRRMRTANLFAPLFVLYVAACMLYRSPRSASELEIAPDSREYAVAAERLVHLGRYDLAINGKTYPPRYEPWFSVLLLAPVYLVAPGQLGNGVLPVFVLGLLSMGAVYWLGNRLAGPLAGVIGAMLLLSCDEFITMARVIMTDVPSLALALLAGCQYVRLWDRPTRRGYLWAGLLVAGSAALRSTYGLLLIPFVVLSIGQRRRITTDLVPLLWPALAVGLLTAGYHWHTFGDWRRTGYQYWCPAAYDYPGMTFSSRYLPRNLDTLWIHDWHQIRYALGAAGLVVCLWKRPRAARPIVAFLLLGALPIATLYAFYFVDGMRFCLLARALVCVFGGAFCALFVSYAARKADWSLAVLAGAALLLHLMVHSAIAWDYGIVEAFCIVFVFAFIALIPMPKRLRPWVVVALLPALIYLPAAGPMALPLIPWPPLGDPYPLYIPIEAGLCSATPDNAVIITGVDEVYLEPHVMRGTHRRLLPFSRRVEYASKLVAPRRIEHPVPYPSGPLDFRCSGLKAGGAKDVYAFTADEAPDTIVEWVRQGVPVYVDTLTSRLDLIGGKALPGILQPIPVPGCSWLARLQLSDAREPNPAAPAPEPKR